MENYGGLEHGIPEDPTSFGHGIEAGDATAVRHVGAGRLLRVIRRNGGHILTLSLILSSAFALAIYHFIEPTYRAHAMINFESTQFDLFGPMVVPDRQEPAPVWLLTEVEMLRTNSVLDLALSRPEVAQLPLVKGSPDPKADIRKMFDFEIIPHTHWVRVFLDSRDPHEAAVIVNAVVDAYQLIVEDTGVSSTKVHREGAIRGLTMRLHEYALHLKERIDERRVQLLRLAREADANNENQKGGGIDNPRPRAEQQPAPKPNSQVYQTEASFLREDMERDSRMYDVVLRKLESMKFNEATDRPHIQQMEKAEVPVLLANHRLILLACAPFAVLVFLLVPFLFFSRDSA